MLSRASWRLGETTISRRKICQCRCRIDGLWVGLENDSAFPSRQAECWLYGEKMSLEWGNVEDEECELGVQEMWSLEEAVSVSSTNWDLRLEKYCQTFVSQLKLKILLKVQESEGRNVWKWVLLKLSEYCCHWSLRKRYWSCYEVHFCSTVDECALRNFWT